MRQRPRTQPEWMRWVEQRLRRHDTRLSAVVPPPVGAAVVWTGSSVPAGWLTADGSAFDAGEYPLLADVLGGSTLPALTGVSGRPWIVRAE